MSDHPGRVLAMTDDAALQPETAWHLAALTAAAAVLAERAEGAGFDDAVPTCPSWTVADLVAHQGMAHRWAASNLRLDGAEIPSKTDILRTFPAADLLTWFADGVTELLGTFAATPPDVAAMVFLDDAPAPPAFWARRQAHETTIHPIDALAAGLGRYPADDGARRHRSRRRLQRDRRPAPPRAAEPRDRDHLSRPDGRP